MAQGIYMAALINFTDLAPGKYQYESKVQGNFCQTNFAVNTNFVNVNSSIEVTKKQVNYDLKILTNQLNANKICLNTNKTEVILFKSSKKKLDYNLKPKL